MVKREIISVHIGQAGIQTANSMWELYCIEHLIDPDGHLIEEILDNDMSYQTFFEKTDKMRFVPRAIFFDTENILIDEIICGAYGQLYHPRQLIKGCEDASNNFARGSFTVSKFHITNMLERIRKCVENCDYTEGFLISHSLGGGTGSGFTSILMHSLQAEYAKFNRVQVPVFPSQCMSTSVVEPYNSLLHIHSTIETIDLSLPFGNEALYELCSNLLFIENCTFGHINRIIALILSSATASLRFQGQLNNDLGELQTNLVPYPRIHYPLLRYSPILHPEKSKHVRPSISMITRDVFSKKYQTIKTDSSTGRYIAVVLNYRGKLSQREINNTIQMMKVKRELDFVDWCPTGFKIGLNNSLQSVVPDSDVANFDYSVAMIANTTLMKDVWLRLSRKYISLYEKKAFIHWFLGEGMEESEFDDAYENVLMLIEDYNECSLTNEEIANLFNGDKDDSADRTNALDRSTPTTDYNNRLLVRRHSSRVTVASSKKPSNRRLKQNLEKDKNESKAPSKMEKKILAQRTSSQLTNTAILRASSKVSKTN